MAKQPNIVEECWRQIVAAVASNSAGEASTVWVIWLQLSIAVSFRSKRFEHSTSFLSYRILPRYKLDSIQIDFYNSWTTVK